MVANKSDIIMINMDDEKALMIDVATPSDGNIKKRKYAKLKWQKPWKRSSRRCGSEDNNGASGQSSLGFQWPEY